MPKLIKKLVEVEVLQYEVGDRVFWKDPDHKGNWNLSDMEDNIFTIKEIVEYEEDKIVFWTTKDEGLNVNPSDLKPV